MICVSTRQSEMKFMLLVLIIAISSIPINAGKAQSRTFSIDYTRDTFLLDGEPFRYISGTIHYFRVHPFYWRDRLRKLRHLGCNAVQTYVEWSSHEKEAGEINFSGEVNLTAFIEIAQEEGLLVILRPGPYICAERDFGGLPYWLLTKHPQIKLRSSDPVYLMEVDKWFQILLEKIKPLLYQNGGPIIMIQVENEYGSYPACDFSYTSHLRDLLRTYLGTEIVLFTTDGAATSFLKCGAIADVYATVDFGADSDVKSSFAAQKLFNPRGPMVNSEFYPGWLDYWGKPHAKVDAWNVVFSLGEMLNLNASVNIYVFHGGTSFGLTSGSDVVGGKFRPCPTSYDYDAPLTESGDYTAKYFDLRDLIQMFAPLPSGPLPPPIPKHKYGIVPLYSSGDIFQLLPALDYKTSKMPLSFEELGVANGIVVYETSIPHSTADPSIFQIDSVHDRAYIFIDNDFRGILSREPNFTRMTLFARKGQLLTIVLESQGRVCFGNELKDFKGILSNVTIDGHILSDWKLTPIPIENYSKITSILSHISQRTLGRIKDEHNYNSGMTIFSGTLFIPYDVAHPKDTFLKLECWSKGYVWINEFLLGRYWPIVGPQMHLYIPAPVLKQGLNYITLLELEGSICPNTVEHYVTLTDEPNIDGPTPEL